MHVLSLHVVENTVGRNRRTFGTGALVSVDKIIAGSSIFARPRRTLIPVSLAIFADVAFKKKLQYSIYVCCIYPTRAVQLSTPLRRTGRKKRTRLQMIWFWKFHRKTKTKIHTNTHQGDIRKNNLRESANKCHHAGRVWRHRSWSLSRTCVPRRLANTRKWSSPPNNLKRPVFNFTTDN